jgi:hypothetical protein
MCQRAGGIADYDSAVIENFLELCRGAKTLAFCEIGCTT